MQHFRGWCKVLVLKIVLGQNSFCRKWWHFVRSAAKGAIVDRACFRQAASLQWPSPSYRLSSAPSYMRCFLCDTVVGTIGVVKHFLESRKSNMSNPRHLLFFWVGILKCSCGGQLLFGPKLAPAYKPLVLLVCSYTHTTTKPRWSTLKHSCSHQSN